MKFNNRVNISISSNTIKAFEFFDKKRPNNISFSSFLAMAVMEHNVNHSGKDSKITEFSNEYVSAELPTFHASIETWKKNISNLTQSDFKRLQTRYIQLGNMINREMEKRI